MKAIHLKVCGMTTPLGIDDLTPRFTWNLTGTIKQTAFRLTACTADGETVCDSGVCHSGDMAYRYDGRTLQSRERIFWQICVWDENDREEWSEQSWFEMGLLSEKDWAARWICGVGTDCAKRLPADYYKLEFTADKEVKKARLYATACGVYSARINGERIPAVLTPGCSEYEKHLYYQTFDITDSLKENNDVLFCVADGWYKGKVGSDNQEYLYGTQTKLLAQLEITYCDGTTKIIGTNSRFLWCNDGPVRFADLKDGEIYDARMTPSFQDHALEADFHQIPTAPNAPLITEHETFSPVVEYTPSGKTLLNFRQNLSGYIRFRAKGAAGQTITLSMFEVPDHGEYSDITISGRYKNLQRIEYICNGDEEVFQPEFFYSGFQYALVEGLEEIHPDDFESVAIYTDLDYESSFHCSNAAINQFVSNTRWSQKSNFVDIPTDCPQREKSGWTGDAQVFAKTASYFADTAAFYRKWLKDVRDCQRENGLVVDVAPRIREVGSARDPVNGSSGWADAAVIIPYTLWKLYGDDSFITENYDLMHDWAKYMRNLCADKSMFSLPEGHPLKAVYDSHRLADCEWNRYIPETGIHWGEWCAPDSEDEPNSAMALIKPKQEVTSAYLHYSMSLLEEMLSHIGKTDEAQLCREYAEGARYGYRFHFAKNGKIQTNHMAELVRPIALGLIDGEDAKDAAAKLNEMAIARQYKVGTGFLSTPFLLQTLVTHGYTETAYRMLENTDAPGWLAMVEQGATTVWEQYTGYTKDGHPVAMSFNHYSPGAVCAFLFDTVCGIRVDGKNHFHIEPVPGGSLTDACAEYASPYGLVKSAWKKRTQGRVSGIEYTITVPANTTATLKLPGMNALELSAGDYRYFL